MTTVKERLEAVHARLARAEAAASRPAGGVRLLCVSKTKPPEAIEAAYACGERLFGESYVSEAIAKIAALRARGLTGLRWHFIGPLQKNKTAAIAAHFDAVESLDRPILAERLNAQRPAGLPPLDVLLQVNISAEPQKSGCAPADVPALAAAVRRCPRLRLRGVMGIAADTDDATVLRRQFSRLRDLFAGLKPEYPGIDTVSAGMTHDLEYAVAAGATEVRIGSAIFGPRGVPLRPAQIVSA